MGRAKMSTFNCGKCGLQCTDTPRGYITGCKHYPPDIKPARGFGFQMCLETRLNRKWYIDDYGTKRWGYNDKVVPLK